ncbi:MAG: hypothetical protein JWP65_855, partial [Ramlibacter sp.]|nr:hypothetical protein [Ramlibacter sp.]
GGAREAALEQAVRALSQSVQALTARA